MSDRVPTLQVGDEVRIMQTEDMTIWGLANLVGLVHDFKDGFVHVMIISSGRFQGSIYRVSPSSLELREKWINASSIWDRVQ